MGSASSKPFQISLSDIIEKVRCYSACWGGQVVVEDHCELEESPVRYNFPINRVIVTGIDDQWQAHLVDVSSLARFNKGYKFLLTCIVLFSKFAWVVPLNQRFSVNPGPRSIPGKATG